MAIAIIDGIETRYEIAGDGPPLLMYAPGGFNATIETWSALGTYAKTRPLDSLTQHYRCILFDRRECGQSGGRVEAVRWEDFTAQGAGLLDHLGIERAHLMGGCMGVSPVVNFAVRHPGRVSSMILYWPVGGPRYRMSSHARFDQHLDFVEANGLAAVVELTARDGKPFGADPRGGPWASVLKRDAAFAKSYAAFDIEAYKRAVCAMALQLFDRDTAPGAEPEDLMKLDIPALIIPGADASHATSAARYLQECLEHSDYWDIAPEGQTESNVGPRLLQFLERIR